MLELKNQPPVTNGMRGDRRTNILRFHDPSFQNWELVSFSVYLKKLCLYREKIWLTVVDQFYTIELSFSS